VHARGNPPAVHAQTNWDEYLNKIHQT
jgi:hypothetical protein